MWSWVNFITARRFFALMFADMTEAYFVGDAAGRPGDHSGTDRKWAINAGVKFYTPEV